MTREACSTENTRIFSDLKPHFWPIQFSSSSNWFRINPKLLKNLKSIILSSNRSKQLSIGHLINDSFMLTFFLLNCPLSIGERKKNNENKLSSWHFIPIIDRLLLFISYHTASTHHHVNDQLFCLFYFLLCYIGMEN